MFLGYLLKFSTFKIAANANIPWVRQLSYQMFNIQSFSLIFHVSTN